MFKRLDEARVVDALGRQPAVALLGPRQVGKTTLALGLAGAASEGRSGGTRTVQAERRWSTLVYVDLERPSDAAKLTDPEAYFALHADKLIVIDEVHRLPGLFSVLRGVIDRGRREGLRTGRFLLLGSASLELANRSGESLAGRIAYVELGPLTVSEVGDVNKLWLRGGFPESYVAGTDAASTAWRRDFVRSYLERDVPMFAPRLAAETMRRLWTMLAHGQGTLLNASTLAASLNVSTQTVTRYIDLLCDLLLVRRLQPYHGNITKRLVKAPKVYVRDCGLVHTLLGITTPDDLLGHPVAGTSWEGLVIEHIAGALPEGAEVHHYRTAGGAEMDLVITFAGGEVWALEIKLGSTPTVGKGFHSARVDLRPARSFIVYSGSERYPLMARGKEGTDLQGEDRVEVIGLAEITQLVRNHGQ
jgi:predicted AAA+ superfamily ATPase